MKRCTSFLLSLLILGAVAGCTQAGPDAKAPDAPAPEAAPVSQNQFAETGAQTALAPIMLDPFTVDSLHIGDLAKGHFNLYVKGGEPAAVRAWVGDEGATDTVVTKAEFEVDHHCAHIEVPDPLSADARLWVEIETPEGGRLKGSTALK